MAINNRGLGFEQGTAVKQIQVVREQRELDLNFRTTPDNNSGAVPLSHATSFWSNNTELR